MPWLSPHRLVLFVFARAYNYVQFIYLFLRFCITIFLQFLDKNTFLYIVMEIHFIIMHRIIIIKIVFDFSWTVFPSILIFFIPRNDYKNKDAHFFILVQVSFILTNKINGETMSFLSINVAKSNAYQMPCSARAYITT